MVKREGRVRGGGDHWRDDESVREGKQEVGERGKGPAEVRGSLEFMYWTRMRQLQQEVTISRK